MQHRNDNMLLFIAIGDAVAAATEYIDPRVYAQLIANTLRLDRYYQHPTHHKLKPGMYTDDTQMSIGVAEVLATPEYGQLHATKLDFADAWTRVFHRNVRDGYARGFQAFLETTKLGIEFMDRIKPASEKNGACMRAVPLGVIKDTKTLLEVATVQASTTHDTPIGIFSAQAVALMSHFALYRDDPFDRLQDFLEIHLPNTILLHQMNLHRRWHGPVKSPATNTVHAVFDLLTHSSTLSEVLRGAIQFGGDTDSVASIALGIASTRMPNDLPQVLFDKLENGPYGRDYLKTLGAQLMHTYA
ncbi:MAG: ADP-ribosylglycohydrolase family protein [Candidatus Uhrbacteria bacterium]|nr:ADP-ribosylglycohydrolase family protein [Candidatus Uhrbacteria bacterium]